MSTIRPSKDLPNDHLGYSCYTLVVPASEALTAQVEQLRNQMGVTVASIPAHVTVKGTFYDIDSLEQVKQLVEPITNNTAPFYISFAEKSFH